MTAYTLTPNQPGITCNICGRTSYHPKDVKHRFCSKCKIYHATNFVMFSIYDHPSDFPESFVVRPWYIGPGNVTPSLTCWTAKTLEAARRLVPSSADFLLARELDDDPKIIETWV